MDILFGQALLASWGQSLLPGLGDTDLTLNILCFKKRSQEYSPWSSSIGTTWGPVRKEHSWSDPRSTESETRRVGPALCVSRWFWCAVQFKNLWSQQTLPSVQMKNSRKKGDKTIFLSSNSKLSVKLITTRKFHKMLRRHFQMWK